MASEPVLSSDVCGGGGVVSRCLSFFPSLFIHCSVSSERAELTGNRTSRVSEPVMVTIVSACLGVVTSSSSSFRFRTRSEPRLLSRYLALNLSSLLQSSASIFASISVHFSTSFLTKILTNPPSPAGSQPLNTLSARPSAPPPHSPTKHTNSNASAPASRSPDSWNIPAPPPKPALSAPCLFFRACRSAGVRGRPWVYTT